MTAHTSLPWQCELMGSEGWNVFAHHSTRPSTQKFMRILATNLSEADAHFIVCACNSHAQLLEALRVLDEHLAAALDPEHCLHHVANSRNVMIDLRETARAAIAAAKEA